MRAGGVRYSVGMEGAMPKTAPRAGQTVYLVESGHRIREAEVRGRSGGLYTVRFTDTGGGIRVRGDRLYPTRDAAAAYVQQRKAARQPIRPGYWHNVPIWQC